MPIRDAHTIQGADAAREKILPWLQGLLKSPDIEDGFKVTLLQAARGSEVPVNSWTLDLADDLDEFVDNILEAAEQDVDEWRGKIKYSVRAFLGGKTSREVFYLKVPKTEEEEDEDPFESDFDEQSTKKGHLGQMMKHTEVMAKEMVKSSNMGRDFIHNMLEESMAECRALRAQLHEQAALLEDVRNMQFQRNMELQKLEREDRRREETVGMLKQTIPLVASYLLPGGLPPGMMSGGPPSDAGPAASQGPARSQEPQRDPNGGISVEEKLHSIAARQSLLLDGFIPSLSKETIMGIIPLLTDMQRASLHQLHSLVLEKQGIREAHDGRPVEPRNGPTSNGTYVPFQPNNG